MSFDPAERLDQKGFDPDAASPVVSVIGASKTAGFRCVLVSAFMR
jgi:hypothetical protein